MMRALILEHPGGPTDFRLIRMPVPVPKENEVLVKVDVVGLNPMDLKTRQGEGFDGFLPPYPRILGWDLAGVVAEGSRRFQRGDAVMGFLRYPGLGQTYAEYVCAPDDELIRRPQAIEPLIAGVLPMAGTTAWQSLIDVAEVRNRQRVLILGGGSGVGHIAIGIALSKGASVTAVGTASQRQFLLAHGCHEFLDIQDLKRQHKSLPFDVILDTVGPPFLDPFRNHIPTGCRVISVAGGFGCRPSAPRMARFDHFVLPDPQALSQVVRLVMKGVVRPSVEAVIPFPEISRAHRLLDRGETAGKIALYWEHLPSLLKGQKNDCALRKVLT